MGGCGWDVRPFELSGQSLAGSSRELRVDVTNHLPVVAEEFGGTVHDVTEKHGSLCPRRNDNDRAAGRMTWSAADVHTWQNPSVPAPRFEVICDRRKQF